MKDAEEMKSSFARHTRTMKFLFTRYTDDEIFPFKFPHWNMVMK